MSAPSPLIAGRADLTRTAVVVCESTACLPPALRDDLGVRVIPVPFAFGAQTFLDGVDITPAEFYVRLAASPAPPKTSPPAPGAYLRAWAAAGYGGAAVICVSVAGSLSTFGRSVSLAADLADQELPGVAITLIDSGSAGMGQGFVALAAARAAEAGASPEAVAGAARAVRDGVRLLVTLDTLEYLARASRIPQVASLVGGLLQIKPLIELSGGVVRPLARVRTRRRAIDELFARLRRDVPEGAHLHAAVQHAQAEGEAALLAERLRDTFTCVELHSTEFTPVMGGYCGPGLLGVAYYVEEDGHAR